MNERFRNSSIDGKLLRLDWMKTGYALTVVIATVIVLSIGGRLAVKASPLSGTRDEEPPDFEKRSAMVPMRDGVRLYTVIVVRHGTKGSPILFTRTPYSAAARTARKASTHMIETLPSGDDVFVNAGYIRVFQDVRGKYGSEGTYQITPPPIATDSRSSQTDDTTDAFDTIDWLLKNVPESNGRVGMIGSSYEGFTVVMALLHPHPALKVAAPESPMVDGWKGDDWFHFGAFRQPTIDYILGQTSKRDEYVHRPHASHDDYLNYLSAGSAKAFAKTEGVDELQAWLTMSEHPSYDSFWRDRALDQRLSARPLTVPTMWEQGLWDQEDMWGTIHCYRALKAAGVSDTINHLVMGPWFHGQANRDGKSIGPLRWPTDTAEQWRREVLLPFFNQYLKPGTPDARTQPAYIYDTGSGHWNTPQSFPLACEFNCPLTSKPLYLTANRGLSFAASLKKSATDFDEYLSDPMNPVPYRPRPIDDDDDTAWRTWLVTDQRFVKRRSDVLTYISKPLARPMRLAGEPVAHLVASTTGTDSDWVVKLIDVAPISGGASHGLSGYELPVAIEIFRGRYRSSFEHATPLQSNEPLSYVFPLPMVNHTFQAGHRIMIQVQSSLFPLYDRNPQTFVPNIFRARTQDYQKATQRIWRSPGKASFISLPIAPISQ